MRFTRLRTWLTVLGLLCLFHLIRKSSTSATIFSVFGTPVTTDELTLAIQIILGLSSIITAIEDAWEALKFLRSLVARTAKCLWSWLCKTRKCIARLFNRRQ